MTCLSQVYIKGKPQNPFQGNSRAGSLRGSRKSQYSGRPNTTELKLKTDVTRSKMYGLLSFGVRPGFSRR